MSIKSTANCLCILSATAAAAAAPAAAPAVDLPVTGSVRGETVQNYYMEKFRQNMRQYRQAIDNARNANDARKLVELARSRVKKAYRLPQEKSPLNARISGSLTYNGVTVEKVLYQSRPNFTVTADLYRPAKFSGKLPAVVMLAGHSLTGKAASNYALSAINLAAKGIAVLAVDPIHQGERIQYTGKNPGLTIGHNILNRHLLPVGENFSEWRVWDGIRSVDYLLSRPDIDHAKIGVTGCSGGGTMTSMLFACDDRLAAAAPSCYITTFLRNVENELPVDAEQMPFNLLKNGGEMADLLLAQAPKPVRILAQEQDFFDVRGARETYAMLKKIYTLLGKEDNVSLTVAPHGHGLSVEHRQSQYDFFTGTFLQKSSNEEVIKTALTEPELLCLPPGGVLQQANEKNLQTIVNERMDELKKLRNSRKLSLAELQSKLAELLQIDLAVPVPDYRVLRRYAQRKGERDWDLLSRFGVETEPDMTVTLFAARTEYDLVSNRHAVLYLPELSSAPELLKILPESTETSFFALDYRGIGELIPNGCDQPVTVRHLAAGYNYDYHYSSLGLLLGKPIIGGRVHDVLSAIKLLRSKGAETITLRAAGVSKTVAILAVVLCEEPLKLELDTLPQTFEAASRERITPYLQSFIPPGILQLTDLDELLEVQKIRHK